MDYKKIIARFNQKRVKDYTFTILFFLIFSVFLAFAIQPNVVTALQLTNELEELKAKDKEYEGLIQKIVEHQSALEANRKTLYVLDEAIPPKTPLTYKLVDDFAKLTESNGIIIDGLAIPEFNFISQTPSPGLQTIPLNFSSQTRQDKINSFMKQLLNQRRLKDIVSVSFAQSAEATDSAVLSTQLNVETYYYKL